MLHEPTIEKLHELRLAVMAEAWLQQQKDAQIGSLSFDERFTLLVDAEHQARDNRRLTRLLKDAQLRIPQACAEDVATSAVRGIEKATLRQLAGCSWVTEHLNVLITGGTGVGKSYLACALGQSACRRALRVTYRRVPRLLDELALARAEGSHARLLAKLAKFDVLVLDDWGLGALKDSQRHDLLEVLEDRYGRVSTVVTSQLPIGKWHEWIADPTIADAILDRVVNNAYKIDLKGPSRRRPETEPNN
ncbi:MAG TPA: IS21-like element helper ATPase IstB [Polyangiaceae bacterium]|nr:IS21-like element helper ATPase IstB [Polyangiaceae bacterium]